MDDKPVIDPESGKEVRFTDNGMKPGDLPGIDPAGLTEEELMAAIEDAGGGIDADC